MGFKDNFFSRTSTAGMRGRKLRVAVTAVSVLGFSLFGYNQGAMSGLLSGEQFNYEFPATKGSDRHTTVVQGAVTSCYELGCFFGAIFAMLRGDKTGRKPLIMSGACIVLIGALISTVCYRENWSLGQFVIGRVITGIGNGLNTATIPVWQSEMSKAHNRGFLVNLEGAMVAGGTLVAYWIDFGFSYVDSSAQWRFPIAFQIVFAIFIFAGVFKLPESPRWLIAQGRDTEGIAVLAALEDVSIEDETIRAQATVVKENVEQSGKESGIREVFTFGKTAHFRRMMLGASTQFFQQFAGCNAAIYYSTLLFEKFLNESHQFSLILGGVFAIVYALSTIPSFFMIERVGRRNLFLLGATGQGVSFLITFACLVHPTEKNSKGAAVGIYLFIFFFAFTILPLPWVYPPEINPQKTRTVGASISTCTNWICNFAVVMFTPIFINESQWGCYLFFALVNFIWVPIIFFFYPETAGRSLEEMDIMFAKAHDEGKMVWRLAQTMPFLSPAEIEREAELCGLMEVAERVEAKQVSGDSTDEIDSPAQEARSVHENNEKRQDV